MNQGDGSASTVFRPAARAWPALLAGRSPERRAGALRAQLGLAPAGAVVMSGHQAALWHPGILAKWIGLDVMKRRHGVATAWIIVDQDDNDGTVVEYPARRDGRLARARWKLDPATVLPGGVAMASRPAFAPPAPPSDPCTPAVAEGLRRIAAALAGEHENAAEQIAAATARLAAPVSGAPDFLISATRLAATGFFAELVERMRRDAGACIASYNRAAAAHPGAGVRALAADRGELPLWRLRPGEPRRPVFAGQLAEIPGAQLAPRALLMTGVLRGWACDLFVHGLGGGEYDPITEAWFGEWLGVALAPAVVLSATRRLALPGEVPSREAIAHAAWRAHRARHDPALIGDVAAGERKRGMAEQIARAKDRATRAAHFRAMHELLSAARRRHAHELVALEREAAALSARRAEAVIAADRTWSFALHEVASMRALAREIDAAFGGAP